ncbi:MAG TPA: sugar phosphate isomerase/epimerase [Gaiellales bacterium]|nr:sugar phosphate isomerase/epimerase [Gaiellales bacterium]
MRIGLVTEVFAGRPLAAVMDWIRERAPGVKALEIGAGGYAPVGHCNPRELLGDAGARTRFVAEIERRGMTLAALNAWGNPLHPDEELARRHDRDLRDAIRLAGLLGVDRVVALAGCPAARPGDRVPAFAAGGWLPYLEGVYESQWRDAAGPYWGGLSDFAAREHSGVRICVELHPGTCVYNVETFGRLAALGENLSATVDPSHCFWMQMDPLAVVAALSRVGHAHAKDLRTNAGALVVNGVLDHRWSGADPAAPWTFAAAGRGHDPEWWSRFAAALRRRGVATLAIEHEDPAVAAEVGIVEAATMLAPQAAAVGAA